MNSELETIVSLDTTQVVHDETSHEINSLLRSGIDAAKNGSRDEAKAILFQVTDIEPENEMAWLWLASVSEYPEELLTFLHKVLNINPQNEQALEWEKSTKALLARNLVQYGITAVQENKKDSAKRCFVRALETDENNEMAWLWLASIAEAPEEKIANLEKVLTINPENEVANTLLKLLHKDEAQELLQKSKKSAVKGNRQEALEMLEQVKKLDSELDEVWILQAHLSDSFEEKAFCFNQALTCNPQNEAAHAGLKSLESILQMLNSGGNTAQLSPAMLEEIEATEDVVHEEAPREEALHEDALNEDILVEDSEEVMASSFAEEEMKAEEPVAFAEMPAEETAEEFASGPTEDFSTEAMFFEEPAGYNAEDVTGEPETVSEPEAQAEFKSEFAETAAFDFEEEPVAFAGPESPESAESGQSFEETHHAENGFYVHSFSMEQEPEQSDLSQSEPEEEVKADSFNVRQSYDHAEEALYSENGFDPRSLIQDDEPEQPEHNDEVEEGSCEIEESHQASMSYEDREIKAQTFYFGQPEKEEEKAASPEEAAPEANFSEESHFPENLEETEEQEFAQPQEAEHFEQAEETARYSEPLPEETAEEMPEQMLEQMPEQVSEAAPEAASEDGEEPQAATQGSPCPFCDTENNINDEVCNGCHAVLGLHNMDMLLSRQEASEETLTRAVAQMEETLGSEESFSAEEYFNLGLACLNLKNLDSGLKYLQKSYILNPTNSFLKAQIDELTKRMGKMDNSLETGVETSVAGKTVMVVDDSATIRKLVSAKLEKHGHNVVSAVDGMDALAKLEEMIPDLILLDITMPRLDGYQVCKLIRANDNTRFVPIVLISGKDGFFDKVRGKMCGSTSYITKPFGPEMLLRTVEEFFEQ